MTAKIIGKSMVVQKLRADALRIAKVDSPVLITGETGTGKDLFARFIYENSKRCNMPLRIVNCASISPELFEAEFFGYEKGAFTGANRSHKGHFMLANKGTLILDEIAEIEPRFQAKLLRAIENKELFPIGSEKILRVDVRIIALTNRDLEKEIKAGSFRNDLFYRLNTFQLHLPPLSDRREDSPHIAAYLFNQLLASGAYPDLRPVTFHEMAALGLLPLPGNVRDLQSIAHRLLLNYPAKSLQEQLDELVESVCKSENSLHSGRETLQCYLQRMEREKILSVLKSRNNNITHTAKELGLSRQALQHRIKKIRKPLDPD